MSFTAKARLAGVLGWPVGHSRSPRLHNYWLKNLGIDGVYVPLAVAPENLAQVVKALPHMGFKGANLTVPHKEAVFGLVDHVDPVAERIGAINTLVIDDAGRMTGRNTDGFGFIENLRQSAPHWRPQGTAVVLGAGGAARAVLVALQDAGVQKIRLINRSRSRAEALAEAIGGTIEVADWQARDESLEDAGLLVNTTTLGMTGQPALDIALDALPPDAVVNDIVYVPLETPLLAQARRRGNSVVDGLGMLLWQAVPGFEAWFGQRPHVTPELRAHVLSQS